ncbi:MAG: hypothetical protein JWN32_2678 [Solirubrobacterales bacterium]|nr:hypothetical protein [Solirubrobacterales bacterium]
MTLDPEAPERVVAPSGGEATAAAAFEHAALPLWRSGSRVTWLLVGGLVALFLLLGGIGAAADPGVHTATRIFLGVVAGLVLIRLLVGTMQAFRAAFGDTPWFELHPHLGLRLHDKILMREPIEISRAALAAGAVEGPPRRRRGLGSDLVRFPVDGAEAWTWSARAGSRLPQLGHARDVPNLVLVFREPIAAPRMRRGNRTWMLGHPPHGRVRRGDPVCGLLCTVRDPELAQRALAAWGLDRDLSPAALDLAQPLPPSRRRQAQFGRFAVGAFVVWTVVNALAGFGVFG